MLKNIILVLIAVIPIANLLKFTFDKDKIEKEPFRLLLRLFISGTLVSIVVLMLSKALGDMFHIDNLFYSSFIKVAFIEEICKWICIYTITWRNKEFNYKFDAIVYSIFVSLGFAFVENIGYSFSYGIIVAVLRAIISIPGHTFFAIYMGYYLGMSKDYYTRCNSKKGSIYALYSIIVPTFLHGIFNYCLAGRNDGLYILFIIFIALLYVLSFKTINASSKSDVALKSE